MTIENQINRGTRILTKKIEADMFGFKDGSRHFDRKIIKKTWYGSIVEHKYWELNLKEVNNTILRRRISYHGFYRWLKERASKILALENSNL